MVLSCEVYSNKSSLNNNFLKNETKRYVPWFIDPCETEQCNDVGKKILKKTFFIPCLYDFKLFFSEHFY